MRRLLWLVLLLFSIASSGKPVDLLSCFQDALAHDPTYQAQVAVYMATVQQVPEARAAILPQITLTGAISKESDYMGQLGQGVFDTRSIVMQANQTIFNITQFKQIAQAKYTVRAAFATLSAQQQDLMMRTAKAYLDVLQAHDLLIFAEEQKKYLSRQLQATTILFNHNDATITDFEQAKGAYDLINADYYAAKIHLYDTIQTLSQITGIVYSDFTYLNSQFPLIMPTPKKQRVWKDMANAHNWNLRAARLNIFVAREALGAIEGNFLPSINATTSITKSVVPSLLLVDSVPNNTNIYGLTANWNVLQGGLTVAQVKAGIATVKQYQATMRQQYLKTMADTSKSFYEIVVGAYRVKSIRASLLDNTKAINHAEEAYRAGEITITEILQIQYQLYRSQTQYAQYVYDYLNSLLLLKQAVGTLDVKSLAIINTFLDHRRSNAIKRI